MAKKIPGKLNAPPPQAEFDALPLDKWCRNGGGFFVRIHSLNAGTGKPWPPLHFSRRNNTRFDPADGEGTLYIAGTLSGALMEMLDDRWGPVGSAGRSITRKELKTMWVTVISVPPVHLFDATGPNLSKIGTDAQLLSGDHKVARAWALRLMRHPAGIGGILYPSRHDPQRSNVALFERPGLLPGVLNKRIGPSIATKWKRTKEHETLIYGCAMPLQKHPDLKKSLLEMEAAILP